MNPTIQSETTKRIVHMSGISDEENSPFLKTCRYTLVHVVDIAVKYFVASGLWKEFLQPRLRRCLIRDVFVVLTGYGGENCTPCSAAIVTCNLKESRPLVRVRKISTKCHAVRPSEIMTCRQYKKAFGKRISLKVYVQRLANR